jgi:hypothetical protein
MTLILVLGCYTVRMCTLPQFYWVEAFCFTKEQKGVSVWMRPLRTNRNSGPKKLFLYYCGTVHSQYIIL